MGAALAKDDKCDLTDEKIEEYKMITSCSYAYTTLLFQLAAIVPNIEIKRLRKRFLTGVRKENMTKREFLQLPGMLPFQNP